MQGGGRPFAGSFVTALALTLSAAGSGLLLGANSGTDIGPPPTRADSAFTTTTEAGPVASLDVVVDTSTTTVPPPSEDPGNSFIDTSDIEAVESAWVEASERPRHRMNWTGSTSSCRAGTTSDAFQQDVLARVNWFRAMAGVPAKVVLDNESSSLAQEAALVMAAAGDLSHEPDSSWPCFTENARTGAGRSNLFLGVFGVDAIDGYIEDPGPDNFAVGHRRWILDPSLTSIGTGDTRNSNALFVIDDEFDTNAPTRERDGYVMWPPRGHVPRSQIYPRWSVSHRSADFSRASVIVRHEGRTRVFGDVHTDSDGYGRMNTLVFEWRRPTKGSEPIRVEIRGIAHDGLLVNLEYEVVPFG